MAIQKKSFGTWLANAGIYLFVALFAVVCLLPFIMVFMVSITDENTLLVNGYQLWPDKFSAEAYSFLLKDGKRIWSAYGVSTFVTVVGGALSLFVTGMFAYVLSNKKLKYRGGLSFYMFFTMLFSGGMVPWYMVCTAIGLGNSIWALILPMMVSAWNTFLLRNFFATIPDSIAESARIDGANEFTIFVRLMLPLAMPGVVTVGLFYVLGYWNDWWNAVMFLTNADLFPLQYLLRVIMSDMMNILPSGIRPSSVMTIPAESVKMATAILTIGPIILVYPFAQRYFVKGMTVGAVKG